MLGLGIYTLSGIFGVVFTLLVFQEIFYMEPEYFDFSDAMLLAAIFMFHPFFVFTAIIKIVYILTMKLIQGIKAKKKRIQK